MIIPMDHLDPHPDNANKMNQKMFAKLVSHLRESLQYPPIIVRPHPNVSSHYQIIDGHHRVRALSHVGCESAECDVWNVNDAQTETLLLTLNRLHGDDDPYKRGELLRRLRDRYAGDERTLLRRVPDSKQAIDTMISLAERVRHRDAAPVACAETMNMAVAGVPTAITFFLSPPQRTRLMAQLQRLASDRNEALVKLLDLNDERIAQKS